MNPAAASVARGAAVAIVLLLAAVTGLIAGNAINPDDGELAPGAGPVFANVWGNIAADGAASEAPGFADPYRLHMAQGGADADPIGPETYGNIVGTADAATDSLQTWGNVDERRSSSPSDQSSAGAPGHAVPHMGGFDGARYELADAASPAVPHMGGFDGARYADAADDAPVGPETWGNIAEDQDAATESLTAPTLR